MLLELRLVPVKRMPPATVKDGTLQDLVRVDYDVRLTAMTLMGWDSAVLSAWLTNAAARYD
ncbi:MAG: hypothetical protein K6356_03620 [Chloroflexus sp.]